MESKHKGFARRVLKANHLIRRPENTKTTLVEETA